MSKVSSITALEDKVISSIELSHRGVAKVHTPRMGLASVTDIATKKKRAAKCTWEFTTDTKNRFEESVFELDFAAAGWSMENPPVMLVSTIKGSAFMRSGKRRNPTSKKEYFEEFAPDLQKLSVLYRDKLSARFLSAYGMEMNAVCVAEFQEQGNPHHNFFMATPKNPDGSEMLSNHPTGKGGRFAKFNGLPFWQWYELTVGDLTGQRADISNVAEKKGRLTFVPRPEDVDSAASLEDYAGRFVHYMRKDGEKYADKAIQHVTPGCYKGQRFDFWFVIGFRNMRRAGGERERLVCRTRAADLAVRQFFGARSRRDRSIREMKNGEMVDVSMWSTELDEKCLTGGTFERPLSKGEIRDLRRLVMANNQIADPVVEPVAEVPPAPWERDGFDVEEFFAVMYLEAQEAPQEAVEEEPEVLSFEQLLLECGFSKFEQRKALRTAQRRAWKASLWTPTSTNH